MVTTKILINIQEINIVSISIEYLTHHINQTATKLICNKYKAITSLGLSTKRQSVKNHRYYWIFHNLLSHSPTKKNLINDGLFRKGAPTRFDATFLIVCVSSHTRWLMSLIYLTERIEVSFHTLSVVHPGRYEFDEKTAKLCLYFVTLDRVCVIYLSCR